MNRRLSRLEDERHDALVGLLAGPVSWFACFAVVYLVTGTACTLEYAGTSIGGINALRLLAITAIVIAAIAVGWSMVTTFRRWRDTRHIMVDATKMDTRQRLEFLQLAGFVLALVSFVGILWLAATVLMNPVC